VLQCQRRAQQRVVQQVGLANREIVRRPASNDRAARARDRRPRQLRCRSVSLPSSLEPCVSRAPPRSWKLDLDNVAGIDGHGIEAVTEEREHVAVLGQHLGEEAGDVTALSALCQPNHQQRRQPEVVQEGQSPRRRSEDAASRSRGRSKLPDRRFISAGHRPHRNPAVAGAYVVACGPSSASASPSQPISLFTSGIWSRSATIPKSRLPQ
jgi:hypothetical protein